VPTITHPASKTNSMKIDILTPELKLYSGEANRIKLPGIAGEFELLENHAPIIAALKKGTVEVQEGNNKKSIEIEDGFAECINNKVSILIAGGKVN
jgi:F-type H+-transporting ATPase subunit epsilon